MRRVLVTGITGFAGSHLVDYMLARGDVEVFGTIRPASTMVAVAGLVDPAMRVEIEADAIVENAV